MSPIRVNPTQPIQFIRYGDLFPPKRTVSPISPLRRAEAQYKGRPLTVNGQPYDTLGRRLDVRV